MKPEKAKIDELLEYLRSLYGPKFSELEAEARKLVDYINSLDGFRILIKDSPKEHVGAIITDAVLQVGHKYKEQVHPIVERLRREYPEAATVSGFLYLLETVGAQELLNGWKGEKEHKRLYDHVKFFADKGIETFEHLLRWLKSEDNRGSLITAGLGIKDRTADYYRVLVGLPDAVKVDSRIERFLTDAGVPIGKYKYKELRAIVQLAANQLRKEPIDLDGAIWSYNLQRKRKGGKMNKHTKQLPIGCARDFASRKGWGGDIQWIESCGHPQGWNYDKFLWARRGKYIELFYSSKGVWEEFKNECWLNGNQGDGGDRIRSYYKPSAQGLNDYLESTGKPVPWRLSEEDWKTLVKPSVPKPPPDAGEELLKIQLSPEQKAQLEKLASECCVGAPTLAKIWIIEHLR